MSILRKILLPIVCILIGFGISIFLQKYSVKGNVSAKLNTEDVPQCFAFRCPTYYSFTVDNDSHADESEVIIPTAMSDGAGKVEIIKNGKIIFQSPEYPEISVRPAYNGDGFAISYAKDIPPTKYSITRYKFVNGRFNESNDPPTPNSLDADLDLINKMGYTVYEDYNSILNDSSPFMALVGMCTGSADGYCNKAFFFYNGKYLGDDASSPSNSVSVRWTDGDIIALEYTLYKKNDPYSSPTGGSAIVRFQRQGDKVVPLDPIPPIDSNALVTR